MAEKGFKRKLSASQSRRALSKTEILQLWHLCYRNEQVGIMQEATKKEPVN
jgi:hypothetical protein